MSHREPGCADTAPLSKIKPNSRKTQHSLEQPRRNIELEALLPHCAALHAGYEPSSRVVARMERSAMRGRPSRSRPDRPRFTRPPYAAQTHSHSPSESARLGLQIVPPCRRQAVGKATMTHLVR